MSGQYEGWALSDVQVAYANAKNENLATQITTSKSKRKLQIARGVNPIEPKIGMRILWGEAGVLPSMGVSEWVASGNEG